MRLPFVEKFLKATAENLMRASMPYMQWAYGRQGVPPDLSYPALVQRYRGWVYVCANISANTFASQVLKLYASQGEGEEEVRGFHTRPVNKAMKAYLRRAVQYKAALQNAEEVEELTEHPFIDLLANANEQDNGYEMMYLTDLMLELTGNSFWYVSKDPMGVPDGIYVLRSQYVSIVPDVKKGIKGYLYGRSGSSDEQIAFTPEEVIHFKFPSPNNVLYGMGPVQAMAMTIDQETQREKFINATLGNMGRPDLLVTYTNGELTTADRKRLDIEWNAAMRGPDKAGRVKVMDQNFKVEKVGWSPSELDFTPGEDIIMKKVCAAFAVPVGLVDSAQISRAPRSGLEGSDMFMAKLNTLPRCRLFEQKLNEKLMPMYDGRLFVAFDNPVPSDRVFQLQNDQAMLASYVITVNEVRQRDGLDPVPWGDTPMVPMGISPLAVPTGYEEQEADESPMADQGLSTVPESTEPTGGGRFVEVVEGASVHPDLAGLALKTRRFRSAATGRFVGARMAQESLRVDPRMDRASRANLVRFATFADREILDQ